MTKKLFEIFQNYFPETNGAIFVVNYPLIFWVAWKMVSPWLDENTKKKIFFVKNQDLLEVIEKENIPKSLGGLKKNYNFIFLFFLFFFNFLIFFFFN